MPELTLNVIIDGDIRNAMKAKNMVVLNTLRMLKAAIQNVTIEKKVPEISNTDIYAVVRREVKKRKDAIEIYLQGSRSDLADKEKAEIAVLEGFLPIQATPDEVRQVVIKVIDGLNNVKPKIGEVIGGAKVLLGDKVDGKTLSDVVKAELARLDQP